MPISPDTQQYLFVTLKLLVEHNFWALLYAFGIVCSLAWAVYRPTRAAILLVVGCSLLLLAFEYDKHIVGPLLEQTKGSLITERPSYRLARILEIGLGRLLPIALDLTGLGFVALGLYLGYTTRFGKHSKVNKHPEQVNTR
jgi:hypothetical protein